MTKIITKNRGFFFRHATSPDEKFLFYETEAGLDSVTSAALARGLKSLGEMESRQIYRLQSLNLPYQIMGTEIKKTKRCGKKYKHLLDDTKTSLEELGKPDRQIS